ncbi:MAG: hypothetical protein U9Q66_02915, partial [Patescibacteria group bacterium]|nr:hypothetical protein [Patescibacteria group bacterium]
SLACKTNEAFVITYEFSDQIANFLTTTESAVVAHNMKYDNQILHHMTGRGPKNPHCTMILEYCYVNDSKLTPSLSLKNIAKEAYGMWAEDVTDLTPECIVDEGLLYYAGIDACSCYWVFDKRKADREITPEVDLFDIYPMEHPSKRSYSRYWFYTNVARQLSALTLEFTANGIHFDKSGLRDLDTKLEDIIENMYAKVRDLPTVLDSWDKMRNNSAITKSEAYRQDRLTSIENKTKPLSDKNIDYINKFVEVHHPEIVKPTKAKNWSYTVLKSILGEPNQLALAIKDNSLATLRDVLEYKPTFEIVDNHFISAKQTIERTKCSVTATNQFNRIVTNFDFKVFSSAEQKKYVLNKGFSIQSSEKSSKTGEDSFNRKELERIMKSEPEGEAKDYIKFCVEYSQASIIKNNFIKNILGGVDENDVIHGSLKLAGTKSFRPSSGGGSRDIDKGELGMVNMLNLPSGGNPFAKIFKKCITVPSKDWVWVASDFQALEENIMGNISLDATKVKVLSEGFDSHCLHSTKYFPRIEEILGEDDGTLEWNRKYKKATETNSELDGLRSSSKGISFALAYLAGLTGLFRPVGWREDTFEDIFRFKDYTYTNQLEKKVNKSGMQYLAPMSGAVWLDVEEYKHLDRNYHRFFEEAVIPAKNMHKNYHTRLYPGLADYRTNTIVAQAKKYKNVHGMLGLYINTATRLNNGTIRTINNFQYQSGSMLTLIGMEKIRRRCVEIGIDSDILPIASIYDSVYSLVRRDSSIIKKYAELSKPILEENYIENQKIGLVAELEVSTTDWASFVKLDDIEDLDEYLKGDN